MALALLTSIYFTGGRTSSDLHEYLWSALFLTVLPVLAYPIQAAVPKLRERGRKGQRKLAMAGAVIGYICGIIYALAFNESEVILTICLTYLLSGIVLALINKFTKLKASGHACGIAGPMAAAALYIGKWAFCGIAIWLLAFWASVRSKRHTVPEFIAGSVIPVVMLFISVLAIQCC